MLLVIVVIEGVEVRSSDSKSITIANTNCISSFNHTISESLDDTDPPFGRPT